MSRSFSILLAEPNLLLREKIAGVLARDEQVWSVTQVEGRDGLLRGAASSQPDFILADLGLLREGSTLSRLQRFSPASRIFGLVDSLSEPYQQAGSRMGLCGIIERGRAGACLRSEFLKLGGVPDEFGDKQP